MGSNLLIRGRNRQEIGGNLLSTFFSLYSFSCPLYPIPYPLYPNNQKRASPMDSLWRKNLRVSLNCPRLLPKFPNCFSTFLPLKKLTKTSEKI